MFRLRFLLFIILLITTCTAYAKSQDGTQAFADLDHYFVQQYSDLARTIGHNTRPLLIINGFKYQLYLKNGSVKTFEGLITPFNELKAVSHIGPTLYAIAYLSWQNPVGATGGRPYQNPSDNTWKIKLLELQTKIKTAHSQANTINWN